MTDKNSDQNLLKSADDYVKTYHDYWQELVEDKNGNLDKDKVMRELHDYHTLIEQVPKVYEYVTGGATANPMVLPEVIKSLADDWVQEACDDAIKEHTDAKLEKCLTLLRAIEHLGENYSGSIWKVKARELLEELEGENISRLR